MKCFLFLLLTDISFLLNAQNKSVKIDNNLTVLFPFLYTLNESDSSRVYTATSDSLEFVITRRISKVIDRSKEDFNKSMQTYREVMDSQDFARSYTKNYVDTTLGGAHGLFVTLQNVSKNLLINKTYIFFTTKNYLTYSVFAKFRETNDSVSEQQAVTFYRNLHFNEDYYASLPDKTRSKHGYGLVSTLIGWITVLSVLSYVTYSMVKRKTVI